MKNLKHTVACLLTIWLLLSLTACDIVSTLSSLSEMIPEESASYDTNAATEPIQNDDSPKIEDSKTLALFREILADGEYTLIYNAHSPNLDDSGTFSTDVSTYNVRAVSGDKIFKEQSSPSFGVSATKLILGEYIYGFFPESKMIIKEKYYPKREENSDMDTFGDGEDDYYNMVGDATERTVWGQSYYCEHFAFDAKSVDYLYDGDTLRFIISEAGGFEVLLDILTISGDADDTYFEFPDGYTVVG